MLNSDNLSIVSEARNVQVTFAEEPHNNQFSKSKHQYSFFFRQGCSGY